MLKIRGFQKNSLIDFPGRMCSVVFLGGCNFRCPFCHNAELVLGHDNLPEIDIEYILGYMASKRKWIDGVCVTGGEPTIYNDLPDLLERFMEAGFDVKLDTNGTNPNMIKSVLKRGLVSYIAMDIKAPIERYSDIAGVDVSRDDIRLSSDIIRKSGIPYEFRTTVVPALHTEEDISSIAKWLKGSDRYVLQQFRPGSTLSKAFSDARAYDEKTLKGFAENARPFFREVELRG